MSLFPIIQPEVESRTAALPLCRETAWNRKENQAVWRGGNPYVVTGAQAVLSWAYRALQTPRYRHEIYTWGYGNECEALVGTAYTDELKRAEAARYVRECLMVNPYITDVREIRVTFLGGTIQIGCVLDTVYGEVRVDV